MTNYTSYITLTQTGKNGEINIDLGFNPPPNDFVPEAYEFATNLASHATVIKSLLDVEDTDDKTEYKAVLRLDQKVPGDSITSKLNLEPRVPAGETEFPTSYGVASKLMTIWLNIIGVLDEDNNLVDEDELHSTVTILAKEETGTLH